MSAHPLPTPRQATRTLQEIAGMTLERFAKAELVVAVHSSLLDEVVVFASDNARLPGDEVRPVYRAADLARMLRLGSRPTTTAAQPTSRVA